MRRKRTGELTGLGRQGCGKLGVLMSADGVVPVQRRLTA